MGENGLVHSGKPLLSHLTNVRHWHADWLLLLLASTYLNFMSQPSAISNLYWYDLYGSPDGAYILFPVCT